MNVAALDADGVIISIVSVDDAWWAPVADDGIKKMMAAGVSYYALGPVEPHEIERRIASWGEFDEWVGTLNPA